MSKIYLTDTTEKSNRILLVKPGTGYIYLFRHIFYQILILFHVLCPIIAPSSKASSALLPVGDWELWCCLLSREQPRCGYFLSIVSMNYMYTWNRLLKNCWETIITPITIHILSDLRGTTLFGNSSNQVQCKWLWYWHYAFHCRK